MAVCEDYEQHTWRIPEWNAKWKEIGSKFTYVTPGDTRALPEARQALLRAIDNGTAERI